MLAFIARCWPYAALRLDITRTMWYDGDDDDCASISAWRFEPFPDINIVIGRDVILILLYCDVGSRRKLSLIDVMEFQPLKTADARKIGLRLRHTGDI
jgi:hypothetical protein